MLPHERWDESALTASDLGIIALLIANNAASQLSCGIFIQAWHQKDETKFQSEDYGPEAADGAGPNRR